MTGALVTRQAIEGRLRIPLKQLSSYPEVQRALAHIPNELLPQHQERRARYQAELLPRIPQALDQLEQEGKSLSVRELGLLFQVDDDILRQFPGVMTALAERRAQHKRQRVADKQADRERELVACIEATMAHVMGRGEQATVEEVCKAAGITYARACKYPQVKALLSPLRKDQARGTHEARWRAYRQTRDAELVEKITAAADLLVAKGKSVTPYTICRTMQVQSHSVKPYPRAWILLEQYRHRQEPPGRPMPQEEQRLITQLEAAIAHFDALGVRITHTLLCHHLHIPMADLAGRYPHARALLLGAKERTRHRPHLQVENLYEQVVDAIQALEIAHEPVTRNAICIRLQVSVHQINRDQEAKALIAEVMAKRPSAEVVRHTMWEDELIERLRKAYALLAASQESLSCTRLYLAAGRDERTFRRYPRVYATAEQLVAAHEQDVGIARSALVAMLIARMREMLAREARATSDLPVQVPVNVPQSLRVRVGQAQRRWDRDAALAAEVAQAIRELEQSGQEVTSSAVCALTGWKYQTLCNAKYQQTQQLMRGVIARRAGVARRRQAGRGAELACQVRQVSADLQRSGQPVQVKTIARAIGLGPAALRAYPAVRAELARILANAMSRYQWERHQRETDLLRRLDEYVQQCEGQEQPLLISAIAQELAMPLSTILVYPRLRERIEQIRSVRREQRRSRTERMERSV